MCDIQKMASLFLMHNIMYRIRTIVRQRLAVLAVPLAHIVQIRTLIFRILIGDPCTNPLYHKNGLMDISHIENI